jgi:hypothetical protein
VLSRGATPRTPGAGPLSGVVLAVGLLLGWAGVVVGASWFWLLVALGKGVDNWLGLAWGRWWVWVGAGGTREDTGVKIIRGGVTIDGDGAEGSW